MAGEILESTVLHEHRKIVAFRHILALVNFIAILASTLVTRHYVLIRGSSDGILLVLTVLLAINGVQIALCLADYISKAFFGRYIGPLVKVSYGVGAAWLIATILQVVIGSLELGALRIDLLVIAGLQLLTALIASNRPRRWER